MATSLPKSLPPMEAAFPNLVPTGYQPTSDYEPAYNCIAWAANDTMRWWWPVRNVKGHYWPTSLPLDNELATFIRLYEIEAGYKVCDSGALEEGFEKIAIFVGGNGKATHAARQLSDGKWTSKMGRDHDICHSVVEGVSGAIYGSAAQFMKRPKQC
jgi:hypothetical protein